MKKRKTKQIAGDSISPIINKINALLSDKKNLTWAESIAPNEVTFLYDLIAKSQERKDFSLSEKQSKWAIEILKKIAEIKPQKTS